MGLPAHRQVNFQARYLLRQRHLRSPLTNPVAHPGADRWSVLAAIAAGGALGSLARLLVGEALPAEPGSVPWGTLVVNLSGCLLIGMLMALLGRFPNHPRLVRPFVGVGILGGFTTFSTYAVESHELVRAGHPVLATAYLGGTVLAALLAVVGGVALVRRGSTARGRPGDGSIDGVS